MKEKLMNKKVILGAIILLALGFLIFSKSVKVNTSKFHFWKKSDIGKSEARSITEKFIKEVLVPGRKVELGDVTEESGAYKIIVKLDGQEITSYLTKDGKKFFPESMDIEEITVKAKENEGKTAGVTENKPIIKSDLPEVKLFVMSYCPYGTQIEKGILPVLKALGSKIKFSLNFVSYAMHDKKEIDENLKQYCIQKESPTKLRTYLECFLKDSAKADSCLTSSGINNAALKSCMAKTDTEFKITEKFNNKEGWGGPYPPFDIDKSENEKYGVQGSPTLVINGGMANTGRDPQSLLTTICSGFNNPPKECEQKLSTTVPAAGFGEGSGSNSAASCGS